MSQLIHQCLCRSPYVVPIGPGKVIRFVSMIRFGPLLVTTGVARRMRVVLERVAVTAGGLVSTCVKIVGTGEWIGRTDSVIGNGGPCRVVSTGAATTIGVSGR